MTTQLLELNAAQTAIYSRSNLRRAIKDFDDTEIAGITLRDNLVVVVRTDGSQQTYPREIVVTAYQEFTGNALSISFLTLDLTIVDHLSGTTMDTSSSKDGHTVMLLDTSAANAKLQTSWADKFIHINDQTKLEALLQSEHTDLGYLIAPEGFRYMQSIELGSALSDSTGDDTESRF
jgi:hypothetical protein